MTGDPHCPACGFEWVKSAPNPVVHVCTGRAGCVQHPGRENPAPDSAPAGADVPVGKADIVERLREAYDRVKLWPEKSLAGMQDLLLLRNLTPEAAAEIARLRAEVERLREDRDRLLMADAATRAYLAADRAALAQRVAEAVRERVRMCAARATIYSIPIHPRTAIRDVRAEIVNQIDALDLGPIVAAALKESAP